MNENPRRDKSCEFALKIIEVFNALRENKREFILSKQLLRSGTSIGANTEEAIGAQSKRDFLPKASIAYKEARETKYWLRLLRDSNYLQNEQADYLIDEVDEFSGMMGAIISTTTKNIQKTSSN